MTPLHELAAVQPKSRIKAGEGLSQGKYKFFTSSNLQTKWRNDFQYDRPALIFGTGGMPSVHFCDTPFSTSTDCLVLYAKGDADLELIYRYLASHMQLLAAGFHGIGLQHISKQYLLNIKIPRLDGRTREAAIRSGRTLDALIALRERQLAGLDALARSRFAEMFGGCTRRELIGSVVTISRGASPRPISEYITGDPNGINWIKIGDAAENSLYITRTEEKITAGGAQKSRYVHKGDFILSNSMSFGRPYILAIDGCVHDGWLIMSGFSDTFHPLYLYYAIRDDEVQNQFSGKVNGATVKNLNSDLVKSTWIKVPDMPLQLQFAAFAEQLCRQKEAVQQALEKLKLLKEALMQQYFG